MSVYQHFSEQALEILRARAERAARADHKNDREKPVTALQIRFGAEAYALPVELLRAVYEGVSIVPVPCTPAYVAGIANVRGRILPVLHLANLLGVPGVTETESSALVVVTNDMLTVAFLIATIGEVISIASHEVTPLPGQAEAGSAGYVRGVLTDGAGLLDIPAILGDSALIVAETFS